jgi:DNA mismatch repair protein MutS2
VLERLLARRDRRSRRPTTPRSRRGLSQTSVSQAPPWSSTRRPLRPTYRVLAGVPDRRRGSTSPRSSASTRPRGARSRSCLRAMPREVERGMARLRCVDRGAEARAEELRRREEALGVARRAAGARRRTSSIAGRTRCDARCARALAEFKELSGTSSAIHDAKEKAKLERAQLRAEGRLRAIASRKAGVDRAVRDAHAATLTLRPGARADRLARAGGRDRRRARRQIDVRMGTRPSPWRAAISRRRRTPPRPGARKKSGLLASLAAASRSTRVRRAERRASGRAPPAGPDRRRSAPGARPVPGRVGALGRTEVRVVHGHGTGTAAHGGAGPSQGHPQVDALSSRGTGEGGDGATVVTLR